MDYIKIIAGFALLIIFSWLLIKNSKRKGFMDALFQIDTILGIVAGLYLIITSVTSLWAA